MPIFTPPTFEERMPATAGRVFSFFTQTQSYAVVWRNGHFQTVRVPSQEETDLLVEGVTWFSGGRSYIVSQDTAALLEADGFGGAQFTGFGDSGFGYGPFGG